MMQQIGVYVIHLQRIQCFLLFYILLTVHSALAVEQDSLSSKIHHSYQSVRALGMGDSFVAVSNDYSALLYNPAGLARREEQEINLSLAFGISSAFTTFMNDLIKAQDTPGSEIEKQTAIMEILQNQYGETFGFRSDPFSGFWVGPGWGFALIPFDVTMEMTPHQQVGPSLSTTFILDTTLAYGYAKDVRWFPHARTSIGFTGKFTNRAYASKFLNAIEAAANNELITSKDLKEGYSLDADIGLLYTPEFFGDTFVGTVFKTARPTFGLVLRNIGETGFENNLQLIQKENAGAPEKNYRVLDLGMKWEYPRFWIFGGRGVLDVRDILHPRFNTQKGLHLGFEFDWRMTSWWKGQYRVGFNGGNLTLGASALFSYLNLDLAYYGEDVGTASHPVENKMFMIKGNINL